MHRAGMDFLTSKLASRMTSDLSKKLDEKHDEFIWHSLSENRCTHNLDMGWLPGFSLSFVL